ncbi:MAG: cytochrome c [Gammaproteobacteria bacterium]|nr:cytochrome c [Gammaproteobacteria bacterium]
MKPRLALIPLLAAVLFTITNARADEPSVLRQVMQALGSDMQVVTGGIAREDWQLVAKTAPLIAKHPQPPLSEKVRIIRYMGAEMSLFKALDGETHQAALELGKAADEQDGAKVIAAFGKLQQTCLACHQRFRSGFVQHFYGTDK